MNALTFAFDTVIQNREGYEDMTGPLDVILALLSRDKIEIQDISLTRLVEQYLATLAQWEAMDMEIATEFTVMASHLVYLKTRMLLRVGEQRDEEIDSLLLALEKRQRQEQYENIKWAADWLGCHSQGFDYGVKPPSAFDDKKYKRKHDIAYLFTALLTLLTRLESAETPIYEAFAGIVGREYYPVDVEMETIMAKYETVKRLTFADMLRTEMERSQRIAVFLALLTLCKDKRLKPKESRGGLYFVAG